MGCLAGTHLFRDSGCPEPTSFLYLNGCRQPIKVASIPNFLSQTIQQHPICNTQCLFLSREACSDLVCVLTLAAAPSCLVDLPKQHARATFEKRPPIPKVKRSCGCLARSLPPSGLSPSLLADGELGICRVLWLCSRP